MKEYVNSIKEVLETRVDQIMQFDDKLDNLTMEIGKVKNTHDDFAVKIINVVEEAKKMSADVD